MTPPNKDNQEPDVEIYFPFNWSWNDIYYWFDNRWQLEWFYSTEQYLFVANIL